MAVRVLHVVVTGAPPAADVTELVDRAQDAGWRVGVIATPAALRFVDVEALRRATGLPVSSDYRRPDEPEPMPAADAVLVAPLTGNTLVKIATGLTDTLAAGRVVAAIGGCRPVVVVPYATRDHLAHPALVCAVNKLREWRVSVIDEHVANLPAEGHSACAADLFPWSAAWDAVVARTSTTSERGVQ